MKIVESSVEKIGSMESSYAELFPFPTLSAATADFASGDVTSVSNEKVAKAVSATLDAIYSVSQDIQAMETFLHLHVPKMEDGNNFGVTVQLAMLKICSDLQEEVTSKIDDLSAYTGKRAEALEKLSLPSTSSTVTESSSVTTTDGKPENKSSESKEKKTTSSDSDSPAYKSRVAALVSVDTLFYSKAQRAFQSVMTTYMSAVDFMDKNKEKLEKPKGSGGSHSGYHSMY